jgi:Xaa-Pro aminopeptidase
MRIIDCIREEMKTAGYDWYFTKDSDPHMSEYVNDYYKFRSIISGFTGSNGTLAVGIDKAYLFTDGRYFIQAEKELEGSGIELMKLSTPGYPTLKEFINKLIKEGLTVACPSEIFSYKEILDYGFNALDNDNSIFLDAYFRFKGEEYPEAKIDDSVEFLSDELTGESTEKKIEKIRKYLIDNEIFYYMSASLDSNMWLLNIRGNAIKYNPMAFSFVIVTPRDVSVFIYDNEGKNRDLVAGKDTRIHLSSGFEETSSLFRNQKIYCFLYNNFERFLANLPGSRRACFAFDKMPAKFAKILEGKNYQLINADCNVSRLQAIKNDVEINNLREAYRKDNKVVCEFQNWVKANDVTSMNEYELMKRLDSMRLYNSDCRDLSFDTISASGPNAAMMHYESKENDCSMILNDNLYLFDSGGQWIGGTTDITRTVAIGTPTYEMKHDYTRVARGMLALMNAVFIEGCSGLNLDVLAREPMWEEGDDYKCGTGHGVGYMLSVHEGPHAIRWMQKPVGREAILRPGMLVSDEPGIYKEGKYGIRIENILLVREKCETPDGRFLCFECLTYVPLDENLLLREEMSDREIMWLDHYQNACNSINSQS